MNCDAFLEILERELPEELSRDACAHADACETCSHVLDRERMLTDVLQAFGRPAMTPGFFDRQHAQILSRVEAQASRQGVLDAWTAPAGSLVLLFAVVGLYVAFGVDGLSAAYLAGTDATSGGVDPLNSVSVVYLALALMAVHLVTRDREVTADAGARRGAAA